MACSVAVHEFSKRVAGNPASRFAFEGCKIAGGGDGACAQCGVALADLAEGPTDSLFDKMPFVHGPAADKLKTRSEVVVRGRFVMDGQRGNQDEACAAHKLLLTRTPRSRGVPCAGRAVEEIIADLVAQIP